MCVRSTSPPARMNRVVSAADIGRNFWIWTVPFENAAVPTYSLVGRECTRENGEVGRAHAPRRRVVLEGERAVERFDVHGDRERPLAAGAPFGFSFGRLCRPPPHDSMNTSHPVRRTLTGRSRCQRRSHQLTSNVIRLARKNGRSVGVTPSNDDVVDGELPRRDERDELADVSGRSRYLLPSTLGDRLELAELSDVDGKERDEDRGEDRDHDGQQAPRPAPGEPPARAARPSLRQRRIRRRGRHVRHGSSLPERLALLIRRSRAAGRPRPTRPRRRRLP